MFLEFAAGLREYKCSPWSTVTFTPNGWKGPCYLIGKKYTHSWDEFWGGTDWDYWESRLEPGRLTPREAKNGKREAKGFRPASSFLRRFPFSVSRFPARAIIPPDGLSDRRDRL